MNSWMNVVLHKNLSILILQLEDWMFCITKECAMYRNIANSGKFSNMLLVLSHGQASLERGFSINRQIEIENMHNETYVAQRVICDHVNSVGGLENIAIDKAMMLSVAGARQKYMMFLDEQKQSKAMIAAGKKRKNVLAEIEELKRAKKRLETEANALQTDADELALKAESSGKLLLVAKSNCYRRSAKEKFLNINELEDQLNNELEEFKKQ